MVIQLKRTAHIVTSARSLPASRSLRRWLKHLFYVSMRSEYFSSKDREQITRMVQQAELGHNGEIQVVIETKLPSHLAYRYTTYSRACQLFAELGVWDTALNSGVLLYLNLCERRIELLFDRGLQQAASQEMWDQICNQMIELIQHEQYLKAIQIGVEQIGKILQYFYAQQPAVTNVNELGDEPILL